MAEDLVPDARLISAPATNLLKVLDVLSRSGALGMSAAQIQTETDLSEGQARGALHSAWASSWVRPICMKGRIVGWTLHPEVGGRMSRWQANVTGDLDRMRALYGVAG